MMERPDERTTQIQRSAVVPFSAQQMFDLVADVESYPEFLPWCRRAWIEHRDSEQIEATLEVAKGPLRKSVTTRNRMWPGERIDLELVRGPFRRLAGRWIFEDLGSDGARVSLDIDFEIAGAVLRRTLGPIFSEIANTMVEAFCRRAHTVYRA